MRLAMLPTRFGDVAQHLTSHRGTPQCSRHIRLREHADGMLFLITDQQPPDLLLFHNIGRRLQVIVFITGDDISTHEIGDPAAGISAGRDGAHGNVSISNDARHLTAFIVDEQSAYILISHALRRVLQVVIHTNRFTATGLGFTYTHDHLPRYVCASSASLLSS